MYRYANSVSPRTLSPIADVATGNCTGTMEPHEPLNSTWCWTVNRSEPAQRCPFENVITSTDYLQLNVNLPRGKVLVARRREVRTLRRTWDTNAQTDLRLVCLLAYVARFNVSMPCMGCLGTYTFGRQILLVGKKESCAVVDGSPAR
jgi:hypothetical protein